MKVKLTPIGEFGNTITINNVVQITKLSNDTIYITFKDSRKNITGQKFCLEKCNLILYLAESEVEE